MASKTLRAVSPFVAATKDGTVRVAAGDLFDSSHPVVKGRESLFESVEDAAARKSPKSIVEKATAAPGEVREARPVEK